MCCLFVSNACEQRGSVIEFFDFIHYHDAVNSLNNMRDAYILHREHNMNIRIYLHQFKQLMYLSMHYAKNDDKLAYDL